MLNKIMLIGNLGNDPKETDKGFVKISLATSDQYKDKDGNIQKNVEWHNIVIFNKHKAKYVLNYFKKGDKAYVEGSIKSHEYEKDGVKKKAIDIVVGNFSGDVKLITSAVKSMDSSEVVPF